MEIQRVCENCNTTVKSLIADCPQCGKHLPPLPVLVGEPEQPSGRWSAGDVIYVFFTGLFGLFGTALVILGLYFGAIGQAKIGEVIVFAIVGGGMALGGFALMMAKIREMKPSSPNRSQ